MVIYQKNRLLDVEIQMRWQRLQTQTSREWGKQLLQLMQRSSVSLDLLFHYEQIENQVSQKQEPGGLELQSQKCMICCWALPLLEKFLSPRFPVAETQVWITEILL